MQEPTPPSATGESPRRFYWELPHPTRLSLMESGAILEDEGYLAHDLNRGRRLLDLKDTYVSLPDVDPGWQAPSGQWIADTISTILQVAVAAGLDPVQVCDEALRTQVGVRNYSACAAASRPAE